ncbi:MAG: hypothetical protein HWN69_10390 [Desulfobacterales bacterium]|nr:hypothetical protein [Desulfobacterales bacterium]
MPYIFVTTWYPSHKVTEAVKVYLQMLSKYPPDKSLGEDLIPAAVNSNKEGVISVSVSEVKEGKLEEALTRVGTQMTMFQSIEGFEYSIELWSTVEEAMTAIGQKMP